MLTVTKEQIYERWDEVPEALKEAFFSTDNGEIIVKACEDAGLPEGVVDNVLLVVGNIILGFTHITDLAKELQSISGMDPKAIDPVIFQIDKRILEPIKIDIAKLYGAMSGTGPRIVAEEGSAITRTSADIGAAAPAMMATEAPRPVASQDATEVDIRRIRIGGDLQQSAAPAPMGAAEALAEPMAAPTIIHSEVELKPVAQKRRALSSFGGMFGFKKGQDQKAEGPAVSAQVSVEGLGRKPQEVARTEQQPVRVVHYTSAKAPEDMFVKPAQPQVQPTPFVPVTKQEHAVDFEPKVVDLMHETPKAVVVPEQETKPMAEVAASMAQPTPVVTTPVPAMPESTPVVLMKTPQRPEPVGPVPQVQEPYLSEIPVADDVVDLRTLERQQPVKNDK